MTDEAQLFRARARKAEEIMEQVLEENRQWRIAVISKLADNLGLVEDIFAVVRDGGLPDEFVEWHLYQVAKDRDRWMERARKAEAELLELKGPEPEPQLAPITVSKEEYDKDPTGWGRKASPSQVVLVLAPDGQVALAIGGSMNARR